MAGGSGGFARSAEPPPRPKFVLVPGADAQQGGPTYDFRISRYEIRNDQFIEFLNDAILNLENARGEYMYFDIDSGNVYINDSQVGTVGATGSGTLLFSPTVGGRIVYADDVYQLINSAYAAHPVVGITWYGATKFCNWLTIKRGMSPSERVYAEGPSAEAWHSVSFDPLSSAANKNGFRLPMDGGGAAASPFNEWYKAASRKSGTNGFGSVFGFGRDTLTGPDANYLSSGDPFEIGTTPVGFFDGVNKLANGTTATKNTENGYGLYDLCGNVAEWVHDVSGVGGPTQGATRGGHFTYPATFSQLRAESRESIAAASAFSFVGFRVAQSLSPTPLGVAQGADQVRAQGTVGGPYDRSAFTFQLTNAAAYSADDVTITINPGWVEVGGDKYVLVPPGDTIDLPLVFTPAANALSVSPAPPGSLVLVPGSDLQEGGPVHDFWISVTEVTNDQFATFLNDARAHKEDGRGAYLYHDLASGNAYLHDAETGAEGLGPPSGSTNSLFYEAAIGRIKFRNDHYEVEAGYGLHPAVGVSWYGAVKYCNWLTLYAGLPEGVRAYAEGPTPDEWHPISLSTAEWISLSMTDDQRRELIARMVGYRLPMDAENAGANPFGEWHKAASAHRDESNHLLFDATYGFGRDLLAAVDANYLDNGDTLIDSTTSVGFFNALNKLADDVTPTRDSDNAYGLYDACGNVTEWTQDFFAHDDPTMRATRGGSWRDASASASLTASGRAALPPGARNRWTGFRVVRGTGHIATVTVRDNIAGESTVRQVILDLREPLTVAPTEPYERTGIYCDVFSGQSFAFRIANQSHSEMPWSVSAVSAGNWLKAEGPTPGASSGVVPPGPTGAVAITATTTTAADTLPPGEHEAAITFTNARTGRSNSRVVRLTVDQPVEALEDGANPPAEFAGVWGPGTPGFETLPALRYWFGRSPHAYPDCPPRYDVRVIDDWLTVTPVDPGRALAGPLPAQAVPFAFDVTINTKANTLGVGEHLGRVRFSYVDPNVPTPATPIEKTVRLTVIDPIHIDPADTPWQICCAVSPDALPSRSFTLTNLHGSFAVPVAVTADVNWIKVDNASFAILPGGAQTVTATLNANAILPHGIYFGAIRFTDLITGYVQKRSVRLTIVETFAVEPLTDFEVSGRVGGTLSPGSTVYTLTNIEDLNGAAIEWRAASDQPWVLVNGAAAAGGILDDGASVGVTVSIDPATAPEIPPNVADTTFEATLTFDNLTDAETMTRKVYLARVVPMLSLEEMIVPAATQQPGGPAYTFRIGRFDVTNAEFVTFLNDAMLHTTGGRGRYMFFETPTGDIYVNSAVSGQVGADHGTRTVKMFSPAASGQIVFASGAYQVRTAPVDYSRHPVAGVSWYGAVKFCNWASLDQGLAPSRCCYAEDTSANLSGWRPMNIAAADWTIRDMNDSERHALVTQCRGYRLLMDDGYNNAVPTTDAADDYNEWFKAAAWNDAIRQNMVFGFGRNSLAGPDANYRCSGDPFESVTDCTVAGTTPLGYFDGTIKSGGFVTHADANGFGLYDMTGNVHQWMQDRYAPPSSLDRRALRGGSWNEPLGAASLRNGARPMFAMAGTVSNQIGFRVVRTTETPTGDANSDGRVDAADWSALTACHLGPAIPRAESCFVFDFDLNDRVDLRDVAALQRASSLTALMR